MRHGSLLSNAGTVAHLETTREGNKNKFIGADFDINPWQRGGSFSPTTTAYTADRWSIATTSSKQINVTKSVDFPSVAQAGTYGINCLQATYPGTAYSPVAADSFGVLQRIEGYNWIQIAQQPLTISFWVKSSKAGIYSLTLRNSGNDRSCIKEYVINTVNTWEYKALTFPASPADGTWLYGGGIGVVAFWSLAMGSNFRTATLDAWQSGFYNASSNQVNWLDTTAASFKLALPQIEAGSIATPFERRSIVDELNLCYRYYVRLYTSTRFNATGATQYTSHNIMLPSPMRAAATTALITTGTRSLVTSVSLNGANASFPGGARVELISSGAGDAYSLNDFWALDAEI